MEQLIDAILEIIGDYHRYNNFQFTPGYIITWVNQFEAADRRFILEEFLHLLRQGIYISEARARELLLARIERLAELARTTVPDFLAQADILRLQPPHKSQDQLLKLLDEELKKKYQMGLAQCGTKSQKFALYIDDILATGKTIFKDTLGWLQSKTADGQSNAQKVISKDKILIVSVFCLHNWNKLEWKLKLQLNEDAILNKIRFFKDYEIQNHPKFTNQRFNFAYPVKEQPSEVLDYLQGLAATDNEAVAFRAPGLPLQETFFSSPANRVRFENILLRKGMELLGEAANLKPNHRPLGDTYPSYKTLGTGTLFFTWRNISNTCPLVFWWKAGGWHPFFPLFKRGLAGTTFAP